MGSIRAQAVSIPGDTQRGVRKICSVTWCGSGIGTIGCGDPFFTCGDVSVAHSSRVCSRMEVAVAI